MEPGVAHIRGERTAHQGDREFGIGRRHLLDLLTARAEALGVRVHHDREITDPSRLPDADLVVAADGAGSQIRGAHAADYGTRIDEGRNPFLWLGTDKVLDSFTFAFHPTEGGGWLWCYGYPYGSDRSTVVVECTPQAWTDLSFDSLGRRETLDLLARLFAEPLDGHALLSRAEDTDDAGWRTFRTVSNRSWHRVSPVPTVLLGDAAHTTHYSIGAGTKLALEDAIGLAAALREHADLPTALQRYGAGRRQALLRSQSAARYSARWFEELPRYMRLPPQRLFALLGQRHSPLLPLLPPALGYHLHHGIESLPALRAARRWAGPRLAARLHAQGDRGSDTVAR
ncbi:FAD-dependent monooxygenase [Streptacidiphilus monticola]